MSRAGELCGGGRACAAVAVIASLAGCNLAPPYSVPHYELPENFHGDGTFKLAQPNDLAARGAWWEPFGDARLNQLEARLNAQNPDLAAMAEIYTQSRDLVAEARSRLYPQLSAAALLSYEKESKNRPFRVPTSPVPLAEGNNQIGLSASWEPDIWGAIRNQAHTQARLSQASAATLAGLQLSLQAELASDYAALRGMDLQVAIYRTAVASYRQAVLITTQRFQGKIASGIDVQRAQSQLSSTEQLLDGALASRAVLQHAIAILAGDNPSTFSIPPQAGMGLTLQQTPVVVPSALLERRPDIAAAERQMAAANATIGVSRAAFYPQITISGTAGFEDRGWDLASVPNSAWSIGGGAVLPLFEGGLRRAELQRSWSQYAQTRDQYRSTVLLAFSEVEDGLALTTHLRAQVAAQTEAASAADKAEALAMQLYVGGLTTYLDVVVAQETALSAHIVAAQLETSEYQADIGLIKALGGGWTTSQLPGEAAVIPFGPLKYPSIAHPADPTH